MLRQAAPNDAAPARRLSRRDRKGAVVRHAAQVPLGRPFVYEPERVGSEPIAPHEIQALFEIESEAAANGDSGRRWQTIFDLDDASLEQWLPGAEDANEAQLVIFRSSLQVPGVPPAIALEQLYNVKKRRAWDAQLARLREVPSKLPQASEGGSQSDVVHMRINPLLSFLPACELLLWRSLVKQDAANGQPAAFLMRNADVPVGDDSAAWSAGDWLPPLRVRRMVHGCIIRPLDPINEAAGSIIFGYLQIRVNTALQYIVPSLVTEVVMGSRDAFRSACMAATPTMPSAPLRRQPVLDIPVSSSSSVRATEFHDVSARDSDEDAPAHLVGSSSDFLGGVQGSLVSKRERRATWQSLQSRRSSMLSQRPSLPGVQLHHGELEQPRPMLSTAKEEGQRSRSCSVDARRAARRARVRSSHQQSAAEVSGRLSEVMSARGSGTLFFALQATDDDAEAASTVSLNTTLEDNEGSGACMSEDLSGQTPSATPELVASLSDASARKESSTPETPESANLPIDALELTTLAFPRPRSNSALSQGVFPTDATVDTPSQKAFVLPVPFPRSGCSSAAVSTWADDTESLYSASSSVWQDPSTAVLASPRSDQSFALIQNGDPNMQNAMSALLKLGIGRVSRCTSLQVSSQLDSIIQAPWNPSELCAKLGEKRVFGTDDEKSSKCVDNFLDEGGQMQPEPGPEPDVASECLSHSRPRQFDVPAEISLKKPVDVAGAMLFCSSKELVTVSKVRDAKKKQSETSRPRRSTRSDLTMRFATSSSKS